VRKTGTDKDNLWAFLNPLPKVVDKDFVQMALWEDDFIVCAAASHPLTRRKRVTIADLVQERWALASANVLS
jgi:DNA-binding transcriptional LysR family regulator